MVPGYLAGERTLPTGVRVCKTRLCCRHFHRCTRARHNPSTHGSRFSITPDETLSLALKHVARTQETTPFVLMLTAFQLVLMRYAQQQRLVIGMPVSGRIRPELQSSIGYYASTAVIYTDFNGVEVGREALQRVKASVKETQGRQQLPFENLVNMLDLPRSLPISPLFQILYIYHNHVTPRAFTLAGAYWGAGDVSQSDRQIRHDSRGVPKRRHVRRLL